MPKSPARADMVNVFVADSSRMNCQLMAATLSRGRQELRVVGYATESAGISAGLDQSQADVAVISAHLTDGAAVGFALTKEIRASHSKARVIMMLDSMDPAMMVEAFRAGASAIFSRDESFELLCKCIRVVHQAERAAAR